MPLSSFDYGMITVVNRSCNYPDDIGSPRVYMSPTSLRPDDVRSFVATISKGLPILILQFLEYCLKSIKIRS